MQPAYRLSAVVHFRLAGTGGESKGGGGQKQLAGQQKQKKQGNGLTVACKNIHEKVFVLGLR